jgi:hypothetical protein
MYRSPGLQYNQDANTELDRAIQLKIWRIMASAEMIFTGLNLDSKKISHYTEYLSKSILGQSNLPITFNSFLNKIPQGDTRVSSSRRRLIDQVQFLAGFVLVFAHVVELKACGDLPLILNGDAFPLLRPFFMDVLKGAEKCCGIESHEVFHAISRALVTKFRYRDDTRRLSAQAFFLSLCNDFGWSVFLGTVGKHDPTEVRPELVHIRKGIPTNKNTNERKMRIRDGVGFSKNPYPEVYPLEIGRDYIPQAAARMINRAEYWSTQSEEFEHSLHVTVAPSQEWQKHGAGGQIDESSGYRAMHDKLWKTYTSLQCDCHENEDFTEEISIGPDVAVLLGWSLDWENLNPCPARIIVLLTYSEPAVRWMAIMAARDFNNRKVMIRPDNCCQLCALNDVATRSGNWILVL